MTTAIYNEGVIAGLLGVPSVAPYKYLSNDWQTWMGGWNAAIGIRNALTLAAEALEHSAPIMKHYPEPIERHSLALEAVNEALKRF